MEDYSKWTSCQMYGHRYYDSETVSGRHVCQDCGDSYDDSGCQKCDAMPVMCPAVGLTCDTNG